ncbi:MAG: hypothetical protein CMJ65_10735 [Planctomycetaceae bacterium]|jgi:cell shape-determining protein MreC|nr:hypothetical protein [Planctomycetaceae bacterium]
MASASASWKPPAVFLLIGLGLTQLPLRPSEAIRNGVFDAARPGQLLVVALDDRITTWRQQRSSTSDQDRRQELEATQLEVRRLRLANARLAQRTPGRSLPGDPLADDLAGDATTVPLGPPLFVTDLVGTRILGRETIEAWQAGRILDRGAGLAIDNLVLEPGHPTLDRGRDSGLARGQPAYSGRRVAGRISRVGRWTATLQLLTNRGFRGLARLAHPGQDHPVFTSQGMLEGTGDSLCRLTLVRETAAVKVGDLVYTAGRDSQFPWPMLYGTVVRAELPMEAPHWEILVRPAMDIVRLERVEVLTRVLNPRRVKTPGVLSQ